MRFALFASIVFYCCQSLVVSASLLPDEAVKQKQVEPSKIAVLDAWVRAVPPSSRHTALYFDLRNNGENSLQLIAVNSGAARVHEIHEVFKEGAAMGMRPINAVPVAAGETMSFRPAGFHIMLIDLHKPVAIGDVIAFQLNFSGGETVKFKAEAKLFSGAVDDHSHHHHQ